jgi:uncharacterized protein
MIILLHTSKTMRSSPVGSPLRKPQLLHKAQELDTILKQCTVMQLAKYMHISPALAKKTHELIASWTTDPSSQTIAVDSFIGDIYSGLHANDLSKEDREYADRTLVILSGLYGVIRPLDGICPYRLEMGYQLPALPQTNLYDFWEKEIAECLPQKGTIVNLSAVEYSRTIIPYVDTSRVVMPYFMTRNPKTGEPTFVVVHAKIARGAFARWLITQRITDTTDLSQFSELGYTYDEKLSQKDKPTFVCEVFGGKGRSIRLLA